MSALRRAFVAVVPPAAARDAIDRAVASARPSAPPGLRWVPPEQWHLTLRFLGPVADGDGLGRTLGAGLAGTPRCSVALGRAGAFPSAAGATVVWIGVRNGADALTTLAATVDRVVVAAGYAPAPRPFRAHVTVARLAGKAPVRAVLDRMGPVADGPAWAVDELVLFESDTRASGAVHRVVGRFGLAG